MLTFQIKDAQLEARILEKARTFGKTAQQFLNDIVLKELNEEVVEKLPFEVPHLDIREHGYVYAPELTAEELALADELTTKPFSHVKDTIEFARKLRKNSWRKA